MSEPYSIFICVHPKDEPKVKYLIDSIEKNLTGWTEIVLCSEDFSDDGDLMREIYSVRESSVLNIDKYRFKHRPNWMLQMYLKMFQDITENDLYFTIDSDCIINRPIPMFENGKPIIYTPAFPELQQYHKPYFDFQEKYLGLPREYPSTFITDTNFISKKLIREMLAGNGYTVESFIEKSFEVITPECYPGEPEIWGQYVAKNHLDKFVIRKLKTRYDAKIQSHSDSIVWSEEEYQDKIEEFKRQDVDLFAIHSWYDEKTK